VFFDGTGHIPGGTGGVEPLKGLRNYADTAAYMQNGRFLPKFRHEIILING